MPDHSTVRPSGNRAEKRWNKPVATVLHGSESGTSSGAKSGCQSTSSPRHKSQVGPYCPYCGNTEHFLNKCPAIQKLTREQIVEWIKSQKRCWRCGRAHTAAQCCPVLLRNGAKTLDTYAILDDGSERTMLLPEAVDQLGLVKEPETLALRTIRQEVQTLKGASVSFKISSMSKPKKMYQIKDAFSSQRLDLADHSYPVTSLKRRYKHLNNIPLESFTSVKPLVLIAPSEWPSQPGEFLEQDTSEYKKITLCGTVSNVNREDVQEILTYQSWKDLVESVVQEAHGAADQNAPLSAEDFRQAEKAIFRRIQMECFAEELKCLRAGKAVPRSSRLIALSPELDPVEGFIRVGGRLRRAEGLDSDFKHPILLDPSHHATKLLIRGYDERLCHPGPERVFAEIRRMFWILRGREAIKREQYQCQGCQRWKSKPSVPKMADLPLARLRLYQPPFYSTGVDCFGPFPVKIGRRSEKRWGIIYKCLTTRAVHLDLLHSMDLDSFLMSLRRFVARRGSPAELYSDQGTNFRGGEKELNEWFNRMSSDLQQLLAKQKIAFHFNPPAAPHFGGTWEREVKSVKTALYTVLGSQSVSEEVLLTVLLEVESILNSKPLGYTSSSVADLDAITPSVLLMGRLDGTLPPVVYPKIEGLSRRRWRHCQVLADHFWSRFIRSYLPTLQCRQKWRDTQADLTKGSVVMLMDPQHPRAYWPIGRVIAAHPSKDGCVRSADIQVKDRVYTRPVARLIPIPAIPAEDDEEDGDSFYERRNAAGRKEEALTLEIAIDRYCGCNCSPSKAPPVRELQTSLLTSDTDDCVLLCASYKKKPHTYELITHMCPDKVVSTSKSA
ncbi:hypothetical protein QQF64_031404 [Cirrhinus molitorella]|uniref:Integrase catalytic domain-containing protein n=1 Tax=Cirrhinus molitorella TaxID=172907 RepID=A0ABR3MWX5_9TELE